MSVVVFNVKQGRLLIRGMEDNVLCWVLKEAQTTKGVGYLKYLGNDYEAVIAVANEVLARGGRISGRARSWAIRIAAPPCRCGGPGLYFCGDQTYCRMCRALAVQRRVLHGQRLDVLNSEAAEDFDAAERRRKAADHSRKYGHQMKKRSQA